MFAGSPTYWEHELYDMLVILHTLGIPKWFMTLSNADLHWKEMLKTVAIHSNMKLTQGQIDKMPIKECAEHLKANAVTSVGIFQYRVECFVSCYILDSTNPVGKVKEYAIKIDFQECGSPHAHCLLWVDGAPCIDVDSNENVCSFIDRYVSGMIPCGSDDTKHISKIVKQYKTHSHSSYCRQSHSCQFGFPKAPCLTTLICTEPKNDEKRDEIFEISMSYT